ncbi:unnamed protein product [Chrysoparadoxa australica]
MQDLFCQTMEKLGRRVSELESGSSTRHTSHGANSRAASGRGSKLRVSGSAGRAISKPERGHDSKKFPPVRTRFR